MYVLTSNFQSHYRNYLNYLQIYHPHCSICTRFQWKYHKTHNTSRIRFFFNQYTKRKFLFVTHVCHLHLLCKCNFYDFVLGMLTEDCHGELYFKTLLRNMTRLEKQLSGISMCIASLIITLNV